MKLELVLRAILLTPFVGLPTMTLMPSPIDEIDVHTLAIGPDVSHWRPVKSWTQLLADPRNPAFIGIKSTQGLDFVDGTLKAHRDCFRTSPLLFATYYHYARSGSAKDQAHRFMDAVGPLKPNERLCLDLEVSPAPTPAAVIEWITEFYGELMGGACTDRKPLIYTSDRVWQEVCGNLPWTLADDVDGWFKRYSERMLEPGLPPPWAKASWSFWQWSDGDVPPSSMAGIGPCDTNYFKGTVTDLANYVMGTMKSGSAGAQKLGSQT